MRTIICCFILLFSTTGYAYSPIDYLPKGTRVGIAIDSSTNSPFTINGDQLFPPASTLKVITALAAKLELGNDFRFITQVEAKGSDIIFRFSGDPTLTTQDLNALIQRLSAQGIKKIEGDIWLHNGIFSGYERGVGWPWDILGVCYSAPASAITLDKNCVQASIYTKKDGSTRVYVPKHQPIIVSTEVKSVSKTTQKEMQCELELTTFDNNQYLLSGCLLNRKKPLPLKFAVQETDIYTTEVLKRLLSEHNIQFSGNIRTSQKVNGNVIATHSSETLPVLLESMLKDSNNLIADNLTKTLGNHFFLHPGSFKNGTEAIKQIIYTQAGIDLRDAQFADGSGLSRNNRITAHDMSQVLNYILKNDADLNLLAMLPTAGKDGTLKYRQSMRKDPIKGHLQAKSGSLYGSYNMAGYSLDESGKPKATFVQFVTDYYPEKRDDESNTTPAIFQFEKAFYRDLLNLTPENNSLP